MSSPPWLVPRTAYLHIPFCAHHCGYCDFAVAAGQDHLAELYLDALALELAALGTAHPVETLFVGGGTPTHLSAAQLHRLCDDIRRWLPPEGAAYREFSTEANPDSLTADKLTVLAAAGVTRVSLGVQSFDPATLTALDRHHTAGDIRAAVDMVRAHGMAVSLDLIFAAPGQTLSGWQADLAAALMLEPDHLSTYGLTFEKGTPLWKARRRGEVHSAAEDLELAMYETAIATLSAAGYEHYEVSNFAKPGRRCLHNERYWANHAYHGVGVGAARYVNGERAVNVRGTADYIRRVLAGEDATQSRETLPPRHRAFETLAVQLRRRAGIHRAEFEHQCGFGLDALIGPAIAGYAKEGLLADAGEVVALTPKGLPVADGVIEALLKCQ